MNKTRGAKFSQLWIVFILSIGVKAQIGYNFTAVGGAFTPNAAPTVLHAAAVDDAISAATNIGFTFQYGCTNYTQFKAGSNGFLTFNTGVTGTNLTNNLNTSTDRPMIAPLWDDLQVGTGGSVNYKLTGGAPNRVLTIEWLNMEWNYAAAGPVISFQVKLYETSNIIEFIYRQDANVVNNGSASIGLGGVTSGDFYSLNGTGAGPTASKVTETSNLNAKPATGQIYRWTPIACAGVPTGGTAAAAPSSSCVAYNTTLTLSGSTAGCGITYQWQSAPAAGGPWTNIAGATANSTVVNVPSTTYYRCVLACGGSTAASSAGGATVTAAGACGICGIIPVGALPFSSTGQTTCGKGNDVTSANVTNVCGSTSYYGGEDVVYAFTPSSTGAVTIGVNSTGSWMGITVYNGCPISGGTCVGNAQSSAGNQSVCLSVSSGQTYYLVIDSWPSPTCNPYDVSISAPGACFGTITGASAAASPATGCGTLSTVVSLSGFNACGPTFQWMESSSAAGPFTVVPGATNQNYSAVATTTTYYQALLTCGGSTALSTVAGVSVSPMNPITCALSSYTSATTAYSFEVFAGTVLPTTDDVLFNTIVYFGFPFCFGGSQYWGGYVASNCAFVFDAVPCFPNIQTSTYAAGGVSTGYTIPSAAPVNSTSVPRNAILAPWQDSNPSLGGTMQYYTTGTAPNRKFVVSYENIPMFSCGTLSPSIYYTGQIKLYETTNAIEIHVGNKGVCPGWNNGQAIMGLHSFDGTAYVPPVNATAHNAVASPGPYNQWTMVTTAYKFQSPCAVNNGPCTVLPLSFKSFYGEQVDFVNKLYWETGEESNIKEFMVERSTDAINFKPISTVIPKNIATTYSYDDIAFRTDVINYYRITAVEFNGQTKSTFIYPLGGSINDLTVSDIYPNPTSQTFNVSLISKAGMNVTLNIKDMWGRSLAISNHEAGAGVTILSLDSSRLAAGFYIVEVLDSTTNKILSQQKLLITK